MSGRHLFRNACAHGLLPCLTTSKCCICMQHCQHCTVMVLSSLQPAKHTYACVYTLPVVKRPACAMRLALCVIGNPLDASLQQYEVILCHMQRAWEKQTPRVRGHTPTLYLCHSGRHSTLQAFSICKQRPICSSWLQHSRTAQIKSSITMKETHKVCGVASWECSYTTD